MYTISPNMVNTEMVSTAKTVLANFIQDWRSTKSIIFPALKYAYDAMIELTKLKIASKCPIWPGNKCSPI